jgi:hypothetical protein
MPHTFARDRFDSWHATKRQDDCLSVEQLHTVLHFLDILYTECYMAIEIRNLQDKTELLRHMTPASPDDSKADATTTEPAADASTNVPTTSPTGKPLPNVLACSVSVRKAPSSARSADSYDKDFPPLSATVVTQVAVPPAPGALTRFDQQAQLDSYVNSLLDKKLEGLRQETARALEQITAKTDSALVTMENRLSLQERTMMASAIQTRVDPINRSYEALVALHRHLTSLLKERKKLARSSSPDLEELSDLDEQIGLEHDNIAKAKHKLCQRHAALGGDAQRLNIPLHDLVELDFQDGPA